MGEFVIMLLLIVMFLVMICCVIDSYVNGKRDIEKSKKIITLENEILELKNQHHGKKHEETQTSKEAQT